MALVCPKCEAPLTLIAPKPARLTPEQRMYTWLFDLLLDKNATLAEKTRAREVMVKLGLPVSFRRRTLRESRSLPSTFGELIRQVLSERIDGTC